MLKVKKLSIVVLSTLAGACSNLNDGLPQTEPIYSGLPAAEVPTYGKGDRYTYDNPYESWAVVSIVKDIVRWKSSLGDNQMTVFDPLLPSIKWSAAAGTQTTRKIVAWTGSMFPLQAGNKITFNEIVRQGNKTNVATEHFVWECVAGLPRKIQVPAGDFATYPIRCRRNDGFWAQAYYAPRINKAVSITYKEPKGEATVRTLQSFALAKGRRVAARKQISIPRGWSNTAMGPALVFFDFNSSTLTPEALRVVKDTVAISRRRTNSKIVVTGHSDRAGSSAYNVALSKRRAAAVKAKLVELGYSARAISIKAKGESKPLVPINVGVAKAQNRRVEIKVQ